MAAVYDPWHPDVNYHTEFAGWNNPYFTSDSLSQLYSQIYQEQWDLQKTTWQREDTAYQRMVEDMKKAGLNPWSGISSGGSPTSSAGSSPTSSAFNALLAGWNMNRQAQADENKNTSKLMGLFVELAKSLVGFGGDLTKALR